jgi:hypothetical protein
VAVLKETVLPPALGPVELQAARPAASEMMPSCFTVLNMVGASGSGHVERWVGRREWQTEGHGGMAEKLL